MKKSNAPIKLTKSIALLLLNRELGFPLKAKLEQTKVPDSITAYEIPLGTLKAKVENDWSTHNGRIKLTVTDGCGGNTILMYFHPDTLNRDFVAEDAYKQDITIEARHDWIYSHGPEYCRKVIDRVWNGG